MALLCLFIASTFMFGQVHIPTLSPRVQIVHEFGLSELEIIYHAPSVRNRIIFGPDGIVPYGDLWRTGANSATKFVFHADTYVMDSLFPRGEYSLLTIPGAREWTTLWYPYETANWSEYKEKVPLASFKVKPTKRTDLQESLQIGLEKINLDEAELFIAWADIKLALPIHVKIHNKIMRDIDNATAGTTSNEYFQSALYLHEKNVKLDHALKYIREVTKTSKARFFHHYREALILRDLNRFEEAKRSALQSKKQATEIGNLDFVKLCDDLLDTI